MQSSVLWKRENPSRRPFRDSRSIVEYQAQVIDAYCLKEAFNKFFRGFVFFFFFWFFPPKFLQQIFVWKLSFDSIRNNLYIRIFVVDNKTKSTVVHKLPLQIKKSKIKELKKIKQEQTCTDRDHAKNIFVLILNAVTFLRRLLFVVWHLF